MERCVFIFQQILRTSENSNYKSNDSSDFIFVEIRNLIIQNIFLNKKN